MDDHTRRLDDHEQRIRKLERVWSVARYVVLALPWLIRAAFRWLQKK